METLIGVFRCFLPRLYWKEMRRGAILSIPMIAGIAVAHWALVSTRAWAIEAVDPRDTVGAELSPWRPGSLDIHQIVTGRGNAAFAQLPDGSTLLIDAGALGDGIPFADPRPDGSKRPGQWIAGYIDRVLPKGAPRRIDTALVTHVHPDHMGGLADVNTALPIGRLIDRGFPTYDYPEPIPDS